MNFESMNKSNLCKLFKVSPTTVSNWIAEGLPVNKDNSISSATAIKWYVERESVKAVEKENKKTQSKLDSFQKKIDNLTSKHSEKVEKLRENIEEVKNQEESNLTKLDAELKAEKIKYQRTQTIAKQTQLISALNLLCNREQEENRLSRILIEIKESLITSSNKLSYLLENRDHKYIEERLLKEFQAILERAKDIEIEEDGYLESLEVFTKMINEIKSNEE